MVVCVLGIQSGSAMLHEVVGFHRAHIGILTVSTYTLDGHVIAVYFCMYFSPFLSNFKTFFLSFHMLTIHEQQDKTQDTIVLVQDNKHRLHCTQDESPQDGLTASSYRLLDHQTIEGHVVLLDSPLFHQRVDQSMLVDHILDLTRILSVSQHYEAGRILPDQDRTEYHDPVKDPPLAPPPVEPGL